MGRDSHTLFTAQDFFFSGSFLAGTAILGLAGVLYLLGRYRLRALPWILLGPALALVLGLLGGAEAAHESSRDWFPGLGWFLGAWAVVLINPYLLALAALLAEAGRLGTKAPRDPRLARIFFLALLASALVCVGGGAWNAVHG